MFKLEIPQVFIVDETGIAPIRRLLNEYEGSEERIEEIIESESE